MKRLEGCADHRLESIGGGGGLRRLRASPPAGPGDADHEGISSKGGTVLTTIAVILIVLWLLGMVSAYTLGGFIHILLVVAIIAVLVRIIQGRRVV